jgi:hypothetical protein
VTIVFPRNYRCPSLYGFFFLWRYSPNLGLGLPPRNSTFHFSFLDLGHSVGLLGRVISSSQGLYLYTNTEKRTNTNIRIHDPGFRASEDSTRLRPLGYRDRLTLWYSQSNFFQLRILIPYFRKYSSVWAVFGSYRSIPFAVPLTVAGASIATGLGSLSCWTVALHAARRVARPHLKNNTNIRHRNK